MYKFVKTMLLVFTLCLCASLCAGTDAQAKIKRGKWKDNVVNDFETTVFAKYPLLAEYKKALYEEGAIYAAMSGSGSTLFGIFEH